MFIGAHLALGLIIGKLSNNYITSLIGALAIDLDHLISFVKNKIIFDIKKFWKTITNHKDLYGNQRHFLHNFITWAIISIILIGINYKIGVIFALAYLSHLFLDLIDASDFYPLYPISKFNFKGPIKYFSKLEDKLTIVLFIIFFLL